MRKLVNSFLRGLVLLAPLALTIYVCWVVFATIDRWLGIPVPGVGFLLTVVLITLFGFLASNLITRSLFGLVESVLGRLPFVRLLYTSTKDLLNAFVGEKRRFETPVLVHLTADGAASALGFITQESVDRLGIAGHVAVYLPQAYNFAGQMLIVRSDRVTRITTSSADVMAFIVSGGVTGVPDDRAIEEPTVDARR
ncbi:MAG TPA: DUF502 domain-containing protein [Gemmatimonadaceae bacterium]